MLRSAPFFRGSRENSGKKRSFSGRKKERTKKTASENGYKRYRFSRKEGIRFALEGTGLGLFIVWICYRSVYALPLVIPVLLFYLREKRNACLEARHALLLEHFRAFLLTFSGALAAGQSVERAVDSAEEELRSSYGGEDLMVLELVRIRRGLANRIPVENLFLEFGDRCGLEDIERFARILQVAKRTGGNLVQAVRNCRTVLSEKIDTAREIRSITAAKQQELLLVSLMPAGILLYLRLCFRGFLDSLYGNLLGVAVMTACLLVYTLAFLWGRKIVRIRV